MNNLEMEFLDHSNKIEGEFTKDALECAIDAWTYAKENRAKIDVDYILDIHKILMSKLRQDIAGKVRDCTVYIGGEIYEEKSEDELKEDIRRWIIDCEMIEGNKEEQISRWHIRFEKIHPFEDGNGRVGRILMNIHRLTYGLPILIIHQGKEQLKYYEWFK